ncbi:unnamed protein product [Rhodiola kirilowii]
MMVHLALLRTNRGSNFVWNVENIKHHESNQSTLPPNENPNSSMSAGAGDGNAPPVVR